MLKMGPAYNTESQVTKSNEYNNNKYTEFIRTDQLTDKHHHTITISPRDQYDPDTTLSRLNPNCNNNAMSKVKITSLSLPLCCSPPLMTLDIRCTGHEECGRTDRVDNASMTRRVTVSIDDASMTQKVTVSPTGKDGASRGYQIADVQR